MTNQKLSLHQYVKVKHGEDVRKLFSIIYPYDQETPDRMAFDENIPNHLITLLIFSDIELIGQINVFRIKEGGDLANVGYHVHPSFHNNGIGSMLLQSVLNEIKMPSDGLVVQTTSDNFASISLARKFGFCEVLDEIVNKYRHNLKFNQTSKGVCLHLSQTD